MSNDAFISAIVDAIEDKVRGDISEAVETGSAAGEVKFRLAYDLSVELREDLSK